MGRGPRSESLLIPGSTRIVSAGGRRRSRDTVHWDRPREQSCTGTASRAQNGGERECLPVGRATPRVPPSSIPSFPRSAGCAGQSEPPGGPRMRSRSQPVSVCPVLVRGPSPTVRLWGGSRGRCRSHLGIPWCAVPPASSGTRAPDAASVHRIPPAGAVQRGTALAPRPRSCDARGPDWGVVLLG